MNICSCILNAGLFMEEYMLSFVQEFINRLVHHQTGEFLWQQACYFVETLLKKFFTCKSRRSKIPRNYIKKTVSVTAIFSLEQQQQHNININIPRKERV